MSRTLTPEQAEDVGHGPPVIRPPATTYHVGACNVCGGDVRAQTKQPAPGFGAACSVCGRGRVEFHRYQLAPKISGNERKRRKAWRR